MDFSSSPATSSSSIDCLPIRKGHLKSPKIVFLGTYTPRRCGIATFTRDLTRAVSGALPECECQIIAMGDSGFGKYPAEVVSTISEQNLSAYRRASDYLNRNRVDLLCVQHEFGIFGGPSGSYLLPLLRDLKIPVISTLHTVLRTPDIAQRKVMDELAECSSRLVVMAQRGAEILQEVYEIDPRKIEVIPHGIPDFSFADTAPAKEDLGYSGRQVLLTFGLLGPSKGIEHAIRSLPEIAARHPEVLYVVLGATHPKLLSSEGERYRESLLSLAEDLGVGKNLRFENRYVTAQDLKRFMAAADIYVTPYPNEAQITSGTLALAFGAGKAVVSTPYWHAQELLADGGGILVPPRDSAAIAGAVNSLLDDPALMNRVRHEAFRRGRAMVWSRVGETYARCFSAVLAESKLRSGSPPTVSRGEPTHWLATSLPRLKLDHIERMTDGTGIFQHAIFDIPNYHEGYCTDDNARAFILALDLEEEGRPTLGKAASTYLAFLTAAFNASNGRFRNFMSHSRVWLEDAGSEDSHGRALWALGHGAALARRDGWRLLCNKLFHGGLPAVENFTSPRAWAFALLGIHDYLKTYPGNLQTHRMRVLLTERLLDAWERFSSTDWRWFEPILAYDNARLAQALIVSGTCLPETRALKVGISALEWLVGIQSSGFGNFRPIGSNGFYPQGGERADFDQQPLEAQATVSACLAAFRATGDSSWVREAKRAFDWFLGRNDIGLSLHDPETGGCCDGLQPDRVNANQGAESSLAFAIALTELQQALAAAAEPVKQIA